MDSVILVFIFCILLLFLLFLLKIKSLFLKAVASNNSVLVNSNEISSKESFLIKLGSLIMIFITTELKNKLQENYLFVGKNLSELNLALGQAFIVFCALFVVYLSTGNFFFLLLAFVFFVLISFESSFLVYKAHIEIENNVEHLVRCLRILVINNEMPLISAIEITIKDFPEDLSSLKLELTRLINQSKKLGLVQTLTEWNTELIRFRDFISLLIAVNEGTSKKALLQSFDDFLNKIEEDNKERIRNSAENFQLYLMVPIILILLVAMFPMVDAISFFMQNSGVV